MHTEAARKKLFVANSTGQRFALLNSSADMNFAAGSYFGGTVATMLSTTRASTGYAQTSSGLLVPFASNVPRITDQGLLVEEARTNLIIRSEATVSQLNVSGGTISNSTAPANAPFTSANWIALGAPGVQSFAYPSATLAISTAYIISVFVEMADLSAPRVGNTDTTSFDFALNVANNPAGVGAATVTRQSGNVYRVSAAATTGGSVIQNHGVVQSTLQSGKSFKVTGFQIEAGAFPTSYIPTTTASATRAADVITLTGAAATAALAAKAAYFETNLMAAGGAPRFMEVSASAGFLLAPSSTTVRVQDNGGHSATATLGAGTTAGIVKTAYGMDATSMTVKANGGAPATSAFAWTGTTGTVYLGNSSGGTSALNGYLRRYVNSLTFNQFSGLTAP